MKNTLALAGLLCLALGNLQLPAQADDWYGHYDHDHDGHWSYNEFRDAHHAWARRHREEAAINDAALRTQFDTWDPNHRGYVVRENVETYHHW